MMYEVKKSINQRTWISHIYSFVFSVFCFKPERTHNPSFSVDRKNTMLSLQMTLKNLLFSCNYWEKYDVCTNFTFIKQHYHSSFVALQYFIVLFISEQITIDNLFCIYLFMRKSPILIRYNLMIVVRRKNITKVSN